MFHISRKSRLYTGTKTYNALELKKEKLKAVYYSCDMQKQHSNIYLNHLIVSTILYLQLFSVSVFCKHRILHYFRASAVKEKK